MTTICEECKLGNHYDCLHTLDGDPLTTEECECGVHAD